MLDLHDRMDVETAEYKPAHSAPPPPPNHHVQHVSIWTYLAVLPFCKLNANVADEASISTETQKQVVVLFKPQ